ncbi:MAG TPA: hypothetical protein VHK27_08660 [Gammaproteobacteria bacterium]|nr:hypothetical protein [Gammaproteobacteria bacterium]
MSFLDPLLGDQQEYLSVLDVEHTMEDAPSVIPRDRDAGLGPQYGHSMHRAVESQ